MKRSQHIRLVLVGGLSTAALATGDAEAEAARVQAYALQGNVFTNDHYLAFAGYYHAPYRAWYPLRYNHYDAQQQKYYHGGVWTEQPHQSFTNLSAPLPEAVATAVAAQPPPPAHSSTTHSGIGPTITRSGFGGTSHSWGSFGS